MARVAKKSWRWFLLAGLAFAAGSMFNVSFRSADTAEAQYPQQQQQQVVQPQQQAQPRRQGLRECAVVTLYTTSGRALANGAQPRTIPINGWRPVGGTNEGVILCR